MASTNCSTVSTLINSQQQQQPSPLFLTSKFKLSTIAQEICVIDYQLRDHYLNHKSLYFNECGCTSHKHNKKPCIITDARVCATCDKPTRQLINYKSLMFHVHVLQSKNNIYTCCNHWHSPPCNMCLGCKTFGECIIDDPFVCNLTCG